MQPDPFGIRHAAHMVSADFASECLKPISDDVDRELMQKVVQAFETKVQSFIQLLDKEDKATIQIILDKTKSAQRYDRPANCFEELCERAALLLPTKGEMKTYQDSEKSRANWLTICLLEKSRFIHFFSDLLVEEIKKTPTNTWHLKKDEQGPWVLTEYAQISSLDVVKQMMRALTESVTDYLDIKWQLFQTLGLVDDYKPSTKFETHWEIELALAQIDLIRSDESAIYHIRTALELLLQSKFKYFDDPVLDENARRVSVSRVLKACKNSGIQLPIPDTLIYRILDHGNVSLHRGHRLPFSDIWTIKDLVADAGKLIMSLSLQQSDLERLKEELRKDLELDKEE